VAAERMKHQLPRPRDLAPLVRLRRPTWRASERRLSRALTIGDLREIARRRTPRGPFDYTDGAAEAELSLARARQAFRDIEFHPAVLRDVSKVNTGWDVLGLPVSLPFGIAPTGFTRLMHAAGEAAGARAAAAAGIPFTLSTLGTTTMEEVAAAVTPSGRCWFQLYMWTDRDCCAELIDRAAQAGFDTLLVTVDVPVAGARLRDQRNGLTVPPSLSVRTVLDAALRPAWWWNLLTTPPLEFASLTSWDGTVAELLDAMFDPSVGYDDLAWIRDRWPGKLVVKGVQTVADAQRLAAAGVDGLTLSNHGGRQLDRAAVPFHLLPDVVREVGRDVEIHLDTGIMAGADIVAALALGARFTMIGRAYLYGLMAGGQAGVTRAIQILSSEVTRTMKLLGARCLEELEPAHVTQLERGRAHGRG